jgi:hypothetical protein
MDTGKEAVIYKLAFFTCESCYHEFERIIREDKGEKPACPKCYMPCMRRKDDFNKTYCTDSWPN